MKNTIIIVVFAVFAFAINNNINGQVVADTLKTTEIKVKGITCNSDMPIIKKKLINSEGIDEVTFSAAKAGSVVFNVTYHTSVISEKKICELIELAPSCDNPGVYPYKATVQDKKGKLNKPQK